MDAPVTFPENLKPPRELNRPVPRETRIAGRGILMTVIAVLLLAGSVPMFLWMRSQQMQRQSRTDTLHRDGREATAEINKLWHTGRSDTPMVGYSFGADGVWMHGESEVPKKLWPGLQRAGSIPVRYLPSNPAINHPAAWDDTGEPLWLAYVSPLFLVAGGVFLLFSLKRQGTLAAEGIPSVGIVTRCFRIKGGYSVRYQFRTKEGLVTKGSDKIMYRMPDGTQVCVLYLERNPRRSGVYPLSLYRVAQ